MNKYPLHHSIGADLLAGRRAAAMTQREIAHGICCSLPTVRLAEGGGGILSNFNAIATRLGLVLDGDGLPGGASVGNSLYLLRRRRGISRRTLAQLAAVSTPTVASLEAEQDTRLVNVLNVAHSLGVVLRLRSSSMPKAFYSSAAKSSMHQAWTTPASFLERLYPLVGGAFALDPCSPTHNPTTAPVRAASYYTEQDDGLTLSWSGCVFMNPPYSRGLANWVAKARSEVETGNAKVVFGLVPARTDTVWWHQSVAGSADIWLLRGRMRFGGLGGGAAPFASALVVWGLDETTRTRVCEAFPSSEASHVPRSST